MQLASLALAAVSLVPAASAPVVPTSPADVARAVRSAPQSQVVQTAGPRRVNRRFGLGASIAMSTREAGGSFRYWLSDRVGLDMAALWYRQSSRASETAASTLVVAPSAIVMLTPYDDDSDVNLRPYIGGGLNYARQSGRAEADGGTASGTGGQLFGGVELSFHDAPNIVISGSLVRYFLPDDFFGLASSFDRTQVVGSVYIYF